MGKAQRSKNRKATEQLENPSAFVKSNNSGKATKIALSAIAAVLAVIMIILVITSSGILLRATNSYKSENFEIDGAMMQYLYNSQVMNFVNTYYQYIAIYAQIGQPLIDLSAPLDSQTISASAKNMFGIYEDGTWHDYFWQNTEKLAKRIIVLCESAKAEGVYDDLAKEAKDYVDSLMEGYETTAKESTSSLSAYIKILFGEGVNKKDVQEAETLQQIASLYYEDKYEAMKEKVYADKAGITKQYDDNKSKYLMADYVVASFEAKLKSNPTDADKEAFVKEVEELRAHAEAVSKLDSVEKINEYLANYWFDESYADAYTKAFTDAKLSDKAPKTDDAKYAEIKEKIKAFVIEKGLDKEYDNTASITIFTSTDYPDIFVTLNSLTKTLVATVKTGIEEIQVEGELHSDKTDRAKWLFSEDRKIGDISTFYGTSESSTDSFNKDTDKTYTVNVFYVTDPVHRDETATVEFGHILLTNSGEFNTEPKQKKKLIELKEQFEKAGTLTKEAFEALGKDVTEDSSVVYSDVCPYDMVDEINDWLFSEDRKAGDLEIIKTTYGLHLVFYVGNNAEAPAWHVKARADLLATSFENWYNELEKSYESSIEYNDKVGDKIVLGTAFVQ